MIILLWPLSDLILPLLGHPEAVAVQPNRTVVFAVIVIKALAGGGIGKNNSRGSSGKRSI